MGGWGARGGGGKSGRFEGELTGEDGAFGCHFEAVVETDAGGLGGLDFVEGDGLAGRNGETSFRIG